MMIQPPEPAQPFFEARQTAEEERIEQMEIIAAATSCGPNPRAEFLIHGLHG